MGGTRTSQDETQIACALEIMYDTLSGIPMLCGVAIEELHELLNREHDIRVGTHCDIIQATDKGAIGKIGCSLLSGRGVVAQELKARIYRSIDRGSSNQVKLRYNLVNESSLGQRNSSGVAVLLNGDPNAETSIA